MCTFACRGGRGVWYTLKALRKWRELGQYFSRYILKPPSSHSKQTCDLRSTTMISENQGFPMICKKNPHHILDFHPSKKLKTISFQHVDRLTELERGRYRCRFQKFSRVSLLRLSCSSSLFGRFYFMHSLRSKILHRSIKKNERKILKMKKVRATFRKILRFFEIKKIENFDLENFHFHTIFNEKFWDFWDRKFSIFLISKFFVFIQISMEIFGKIEKFSISKNLKIFRKVALTFFVFKNFR